MSPIKRLIRYCIDKEKAADNDRLATLWHAAAWNMAGLRFPVVVENALFENADAVIASADKIWDGQLSTHGAGRAIIKAVMASEA